MLYLLELMFNMESPFYESVINFLTYTEPVMLDIVE